MTFLPAAAAVEFDREQLPFAGHGKPGSLLDVALHFSVLLEHTCGGNCACTTCHVIVREGYQSLEPADELEDDYLDKAWGLEPESRLSCQAVVADENLVVEIPLYTINMVSERH